MQNKDCPEESKIMDEIRLGTIGSSVIVHSILDNAMRTEGIRLVAVYSSSEGCEKGVRNSFSG